MTDTERPRTADSLDPGSGSEVARVRHPALRLDESASGPATHEDSGRPAISVIDYAGGVEDAARGAVRSVPPAVLLAAGVLGAVGIGTATAIAPALGVLLLLGMVYAFVVLERPWVGVLVLATVATGAAGIGRGLPVPGLKLSEVLIIGTGVLLVATVWGPKLDIVDFGALGYVLVTAIASIAHPLLRGDAVAIDHLQTAFGPALFFLLYRGVRAVAMSRRQREIVVGAMVAAALVSVAVGFGQRFDLPGVRDFVAGITDGGVFENWTYLNTPKGARATGLFEIWHSFAGYLLPLLLLCVGAALNRGVRRPIRRGAAVLAVVLASGLLISQSLTAIAVLAPAALAVAFLNGNKLRAVALLLLVVLAASVVAGGALTDRIAEQFDPASGTLLGSNLDARIAIWTQDYAGPMSQYWAFGYGPDLPPEVDWGHTESLYITLLLRGGVLLVAAFVVFYAAVAAAAYRRLRSVEGFERVIASVVLVLIPTSALISVIWPYFTSSGFPQVFWVLLGIMCAPVAGKVVGRVRGSTTPAAQNSGGLDGPAVRHVGPADRPVPIAGGDPKPVKPRHTAPDLTTQSIAGALWFLLQTVAIKGSNFVFQIALAYLLAPEDFGAIGLALSVTALADVLHQSGLAQVVVQRKTDLSTQSGSIFWLSMVLGVGAMSILVLVAQPIESLLDTPGVAGLIMVIALAVPINAANIVPRSDLIARLRFSRTAAISGLQFMLQGALSVVFALFGFGAMSFAIPVPIAAFVALLLYARHRPLGISWPPVRERWRSLFRDTAVLISTSWLVKVVDFGDYFLLGLFTDPVTVGLYFFAFRLAAQSATIVAHNVGRVMFPALVKVSDGTERLAAAFDRASRALAGVGIPLAVLLVFFGADVVYALFDPAWEGAAVYVQALSFAAAIRTVSESHSHLLRAQGRFREMLRWNIVGTTVFLLVVTLGGALAGAAGVVVAVVGHATLDGWIRYFLTTKPLGGRVLDFPRVLAGPMVSSAAVCSLALAIAVFVLGADGHGWVRLLLGAGTMAVLYLPALRLVDRETSDILWRVIDQAAAPIRRRKSARPAPSQEVTK